MEMVKDSDLLSVQEARTLVLRAREAWSSFSHFSQEQVDRIVAAAAEAAGNASEELARSAVHETGFGVVKHKFVKNKFAAVDVYRFIKDLKTVGIIREVPERKLYEIAEPVGVVAAVIPSTNPTSTAIYKILICLKSRNTIVCSPHPTARHCIQATAKVMRDAALAAGAPEGTIECMEQVSLEGTQELMRHRHTSVILATGGMGLVRAAYSSGKPAYGVGPGNVPAYVESSADVVKAVGDVLTGKSFDNGTLCCSEQALICDESISARVREEVVQQGGYFLSPEQIRAVAAIAVTPARLANPEIVGKSAAFIAERAGFAVPKGTRVLVAELDGVGREYPLSIEKLSPILAFYVVADWHEGCERSKQVLRYGGMGHTLSIHSQNQEIIMEFALQKPAYRIIVNSSATHGAVGFSSGLDPAMTLGCGAYGGNITSDNISPMHLINIKRLAFEMRPVDVDGAAAEYGFKGAGPEPPPTTPTLLPVEEAVSRFLDRRGFSASPPAAPIAPVVPGIVDAVGSHPAGEPSDGDATSESTETGVPSPTSPLDFVSENDVRTALHQSRKLPVGPRTVVTPSARDLGNEHDIFIRVS
jgi:acetaldehyde dehydrogenase (acetylating)